jgi:hypothetical protein
VVLSYFDESEACVNNATSAIKQELPDFDVRLFVYGKGPGQQPAFVTHTLPNAGREGGTYLHHIIEHYAELADHVLFLQACPNPRFRWIPLPEEAAGVGNEDLHASLAAFREHHASVNVMNFGASEIGTCEGTVCSRRCLAFCAL